MQQLSAFSNCVFDVFFKSAQIRYFCEKCTWKHPPLKTAGLVRESVEFKNMRNLRNKPVVLQTNAEVPPV